MHLLSVAMENNLHKTCPPNCQDMLVWLPYTVTLKILMYLDPGKASRDFFRYVNHDLLKYRGKSNDSYSSVIGL